MGHAVIHTIKKNVRMCDGRAVGLGEVIGYGTALDSKEKWGFLHCYNQLCDHINHKSNQQ
jgi:hypothetical protein